MAELERVRRWADALIALHLDPSWSFGFDHAKTRAGLCNYTAKRITVSRHLAARYEDDEIHPAGHLHYRYRRPTRPLACGRCSRRFDARNAIEWVKRGRAGPIS
jgi:hypothetical protein